MLHLTKTGVLRSESPWHTTFIGSSVLMKSNSYALKSVVVILRMFKLARFCPTCAFSNAKRNDGFLKVFGSTIVPTLRIVDFVVAPPDPWVMMQHIDIDERFCLKRSRSQHASTVAD